MKKFKSDPTLHDQIMKALKTTPKKLTKAYSPKAYYKRSIRVDSLSGLDEALYSLRVKASYRDGFLTVTDKQEWEPLPSADQQTVYTVWEKREVTKEEWYKRFPPP